MISHQDFHNIVCKDESESDDESDNECTESMAPFNRKAWLTKQTLRPKMHNKDGPRFGLWCDFSPNIVAQYENAINSKFQFVVTPIINPLSSEFKPHCDLNLASADWTKYVVGRIITDDIDRESCNLKKIETQTSYASHLAVPVIVFDCPQNNDGIIRLARLLNSKVVAASGLLMSQLWINIRISSKIAESFEHRNDVDGITDPRAQAELVASGTIADPWQQWNKLRSLISNDRRIGVILELCDNLPDDEELQRWCGEPIKALHIPTSIFITNQKGFPVLSRPCRRFVQNIVEKTAHDVQFIIRESVRGANLLHYVQYLDNAKNQAIQYPSDAVSRFARGYEDYLQIPLQPLMDNLESCTYEIFEKDPVKYTLYEEAIKKVMETKKGINELIVMVVGAGRGPLVRATLSAAETLKRSVFVYAVEKNPNAVFTLRSILETEWGGPNANVQVIDSDMRDWISPRKADIVVSELLGSFGDNELSPECLDGIWKSVKEDAVSIPQSYTSYLAPIQSSKIHAETAAVREKDKPWYSPFECGYVVHLKNYYLIDKPQPLFTFEHTKLDKPVSERDNSRYGSLEFTSKIDCLCHGFAGYFETTLFDNIKLGTVVTHPTPDMFSWFPIYFPIVHPIQVKANETIKVNFWRQINKRAVWYEWCVTSPSISQIHNPNGRSHNIGLH
ncbi:protein arginine N-methyltransferase 5-like protein [Leptotrombidium deliense]|uniref:Protein arginine N-methyltransferase n=1 Tax=Leptotrombidium deliense TaxID=299467 RepID=A0A443S9F1_9ACAR|nr:protein arginine N-methyltransferase 5-like protein [Leptotrombidium deliense]